MQQRYYILGMTCENCRKSVHEKINSLKKVNSVSVFLDKEEALVQSETEIEVNEIRRVLGAKYTLRKAPIKSSLANSKFQNKWKSLFPLFLIFVYIISGTLFLRSITDASIQESMHFFMGLFFVTFSFFKYLDYSGFPRSFSLYDPLAKRSMTYAKIYPFIETALGIAFLLEWKLPIVLIITLSILSITTFGVLQAILKKSIIECACLGTALKLPMTEATLIENGIMISMACILLVGYII